MEPVKCCPSGRTKNLIWTKVMPSFRYLISLELVDAKSNRLALNARVKVTAGDLVQKSEV